MAQNRSNWMCIIGLLVAQLTLSLIWTSGASAAVNLFGSKELSSTKLEKFEKWTGVLERYAKDEPNELAKCQITASEPCHIAKWRIFLNKLKGLAPLDQ